MAMSATTGVGNGGSIAPRAQLNMFGGHAASAPTARGFEPLRAEPNGFRVHHLNHSVTLSWKHCFASKQANKMQNKSDLATLCLILKVCGASSSQFCKRLWGCSVLQQQLRRASHCVKTVWPSGLRRWLKAPVRKGVGSNPTAVNVFFTWARHRMSPTRSVSSWRAHPPGKLSCVLVRHHSQQDSLAEWSKALAPGASPQGRGFEPHSCHFVLSRSHRRVLSLHASTSGPL